MRVKIVGRGRAGRAFGRAFSRVGVDVEVQPGRGDERVEGAPADVVLLCVPDDAIGATAARVDPGDAAVVHVAGSRGLDVLGRHSRTGSIHPLMSLPDGETGARRLLDGCVFAVAGDPICVQLAERLGGRAIEVPDEQRALYHATASVAANHLVALCGQVERLAALVGVPVDAYWRLMSTTLANVVETGPAAALTGPAARGDEATLAAHLAALPADERPLYESLMNAACALADVLDVTR